MMFAALMASWAGVVTSDQCPGPRGSQLTLSSHQGEISGRAAWPRPAAVT